VPVQFFNILPISPSNTFQLTGKETLFDYCQNPLMLGHLWRFSLPISFQESKFRAAAQCGKKTKQPVPVIFLLCVSVPPWFNRFFPNNCSLLVALAFEFPDQLPTPKTPKTPAMARNHKHQLRNDLCHPALTKSHDLPDSYPL
jgi:hypothetical protein